MRIFISSIILLLITVKLHAQNVDHFCGHQHVMNKIDQLSSAYSEHFRALTDEFNSNRNSTQFGPCTVNVVVHIVYFNEEANVSDDLVFSQIDILNRRLNHLNSDTSLLRDQFLPITGNPSDIFFKLAEIDPQGNSTSGIVRVQTNRDGFGNSSEFLSEGVKFTSEGGSSAWNTQRYLNIWVCDTKDETGMPTLAKYAIPPANLPNWPGGFVDIVDGVVIQWEYFGNDNDDLGKVAIHEVGHYFGLRHIWGDDINCTGDDGINDTPSASDYSYFLCSQNSNTCEDNINGEDLFDMVENYMDYSFPGC